MFVAVDWSGAADERSARDRTWVACACRGGLRSLENGRTREEVVDWLVRLVGTERRSVIGLDFSFSFPAWFVEELGCAEVSQLWRVVADRGEQWLGECKPPFWGRRGAPRPVDQEHFRWTELRCPAVGGVRPKSTFQVGGAGSVGTSSIRGMPHLLRLRDAGCRIWPFDPPGLPMVVEIYPRLLTGAVRKSQAAERSRHPCTRSLPLGARGRAESSEDAFDAAVSAMTMASHGPVFASMAVPADPAAATEGAIWVPGDGSLTGALR